MRKNESCWESWLRRHGYGWWGSVPWKHGDYAFGCFVMYLRSPCAWSLWGRVILREDIAQKSKGKVFVFSWCVDVFLSIVSQHMSQCVRLWLRTQLAFLFLNSPRRLQQWYSATIGHQEFKGHDGMTISAVQSSRIGQIQHGRIEAGICSGTEIANAVQSKNA